MKKIISLLLLTVALCTQVNAQGYNYLGKHVLFNANVTVSPSWFNPNPMTPYLTNLSTHAQRYLGINYWVTPSVEAIVWKKGSVGVGYNFYKSPFKGKIADLVNNPYDYYSYYDYHDFTGMITAHGFNVFYKQYLGNTFAPLGHYFKFNFDGFFYDYNIVYYENDNPHYDYGKDMLFGFKAEYGYDFLVFDRLRLSVGVSIGTTFNNFTPAFEQIVGEDYSPEYKISDYANARMWMAYWFGIKLGVGFLAF